MVEKSTEQIVYECANLLKEFGFSEYEAYTFVYHLAGVSGSVRAEIEERVPSAELFETLWAWSEEGAGSLLVTDERTALVSVLVDRDATESIHETGIWGTGERNSLVVVLRTIFTWRLGTLASGSGE